MKRISCEVYKNRGGDVRVTIRMDLDEALAFTVGRADVVEKVRAAVVAALEDEKGVGFDNGVD